MSQCAGTTKHYKEEQKCRHKVTNTKYVSLTDFLELDSIRLYMKSQSITHIKVNRSVVLIDRDAGELLRLI